MTRHWLWAAGLLIGMAGGGLGGQFLHLGL